MPKFSVIIPAYRDPGTVFENIERMYAESRDVEFLIGPEAWSDDDLDRLEELAKRYPIKIRAHRERQGKVNKLNELIGIAEGEIFVFLDNDVEIVSEKFLEPIENALKRGDFGMGRILLRGEKWPQRGARFDYLGTNATVYVQEHTGASFGVNGACIIAKREVVEKLGGFHHVLTEDSDFGYRASEAGFKPVYARDAVVRTGAPETWGAWYRQRKRWAIGGAQAAKIHSWFHKKHPEESFIQVTTMFPFWFMLIMHLILPAPIGPKILAVTSAMLTWASPLFLILAYLGWIATFIYQLPVAIIGTLVVGGWALHWKRILGFEKIRPVDLAFYYFVYAPLWASMLIGALVYVAVRGTDIKECCGWKA